MELVGPLGLCNRLQFGDVLVGAIAETDGPWIVRLQQLDLQFTPVPARLRFIALGVNHLSPAI